DGYLGRWYPPEYPARDEVLHVFPALPIGADGVARALEELVAAGPVEAREAEMETHARGGLTGVSWRARAAGRVLDLAALVAARPRRRPLRLRAGAHGRRSGRRPGVVRARGGSRRADPAAARRGAEGARRGPLVVGGLKPSRAGATRGPPPKAGRSEATSRPKA